MIIVAVGDSAILNDIDAMGLPVDEFIDEVVSYTPGDRGGWGSTGLPIRGTKVEEAVDNLRLLVHYHEKLGRIWNQRKTVSDIRQRFFLSRIASGGCCHAPLRIRVENIWTSRS